MHITKEQYLQAQAGYRDGNVEAVRDLRKLVGALFADTSKVLDAMEAFAQEFIATPYTDEAAQAIMERGAALETDLIATLARLGRFGLTYTAGSVKALERVVAADTTALSSINSAPIRGNN